VCPRKKAFRSYVESLSLRRLAAAEIERLRSEFGRLDTVLERVERTSRMLTEMTHGVGIAAAIPQVSPALERIELIALPDRRVLMVVVTRDRQVRNRVVGLEEPVSAAELDSIRKLYQPKFLRIGRSRTFAAQRAERLRHASATYDAILRKLTVLYAKGLLDLPAAPEVHMEGASTWWASICI